MCNIGYVAKVNFYYPIGIVIVMTMMMVVIN